MNKYKGMVASKGIVIGEARVISRKATDFKRVVQAPHREKSLLESAINLAKNELSYFINISEGEHSDILTFQLVLLSDEGLLEGVYEKIEQGYGSAKAVEISMEEYCHKIKSIGDDYFIHRTYDIRDVLGRVIDILDGTKRDRFSLDKPCIILADDILPSDLASIEREKAQGFITVNGSYQSHSNIIARTMEIPSICGVSNEILNPLHHGKTVVLDGITGEVIINPSESVLELYKHKLKQQEKNKLIATESDLKVLNSKTGKPIRIYANCDEAIDIQKSIHSASAEGIGLVRSEILFLKDTPPTFKTQVEFYEACIKASEDKPIYIRTFDLGADKPCQSITFEKEPNPALGMRGVRLKKLHPDLFISQLRALYIAANNTKKINVMIPMITTEHDLIDYLSTAKEVLNRLLIEGLVTLDNVEWGVMIEVPSAALISDTLAKHVKFFSIGTNDLTQYTTASDRLNRSVEAYYNFMDEGVLKLIDIVIKNAKKHDIPVSICGESAAIFELAVKYIDMGVDTISMAQSAIIPLKQELNKHYTK